jgi:uncharacterized membrane protein YkvA (DUF1232 family)
MLKSLRPWANRLMTDLTAIYLAGRDPRVAWGAKVLALVTAAYAFSPIDLIPDFIPIVGYIDDLVLLPLFILLTVRLIPNPLMAELRAEAAKRIAEHSPVNKIAAAVIIAVWLGLAALGGFLLRNAIGGGMVR